MTYLLYFFRFPDTTVSLSPGGPQNFDLSSEEQNRDAIPRESGRAIRAARPHRNPAVRPAPNLSLDIFR